MVIAVVTRWVPTYVHDGEGCGILFVVVVVLVAGSMEALVCLIL